MKTLANYTNERTILKLLGIVFVCSIIALFLPAISSEEETTESNETIEYTVSQKVVDNKKINEKKSFVVAREQIITLEKSFDSLVQSYQKSKHLPLYLLYCVLLIERTLVY